MGSVCRTVKCGLYGLYKLLTKPKILAVLLVIYLYMESRSREIALFLANYNERINAFGLFSQRLSDVQFVLVAGIGLMLILSDAPFFDGAQQAVLLRAGKMPWIAGQVLYIIAVTALYLLTLLLFQHIMLAPHIEYGRNWGRAIRTLAETSMARDYGVQIPFFKDIMARWTARRCFALSMALRWTAYVTAALVMFSVNLSLRTKLGAFASIFVLLLDIVIDTALPYRFYIFSVSSLARPLIMDFGYNSYLPDVELAMVVLFGSFFAMIVISLFLGRRCDLIARAERD